MEISKFKEWKSSFHKPRVERFKSIKGNAQLLANSKIDISVNKLGPVVQNKAVS